jgi:ABC-type proline/glycine betaine transport system permease subunit
MGSSGGEETARQTGTVIFAAAIVDSVPPLALALALFPTPVSIGGTTSLVVLTTLTPSPLALFALAFAKNVFCASFSPSSPCKNGKKT